MRVMFSATPREIPIRSVQTIESRFVVYGTAVVLLVAIISIALTLQGWKSRVPAVDLLTHIYSAHGFIESGTLPKHGDTGSYGSYKTPGTAWLMMPGIALFDDPRLSKYVGAGFLHLATLIGILLLARQCFGARTAYLAVVLYGLSAQGIWLAGSLWPNGRPDFYVWLVLLTSLWVKRQDPRYLAAALAVWGLGMYVDMAIAPAFFIVPFIWFYYRPPVRFAPLLVIGLIVLTAWSPYLWFESTRGFADMKSQLLLQNIFPASYVESWCDPELPLYASADRLGTNGDQGSAIHTSEAGDSTRLRHLWSRVEATKAKVLSNFNFAVSFPGASMALLLMVLGSLLLCSQSLSNATYEVATRFLLSQRWFKPLALTLILAGIIAGGSVITWWFGTSGDPVPAAVITKLPKLLLLGAVILLAAPWAIATSHRVLTRLGLQIPSTKRAEIQSLLVFCLIIPWFILVVVAEPGKPERFWWLWPLQVIFLSAFVTYFLSRFAAAKAVRAAAQAAVALVLVANPFLLGRVHAWRAYEWAGADAEEIQVIDTIARELKAEGKHQAAIGYEMFIYPFMANYNITNPIYKVGAEFDLLFKYRHGIANGNRCAEGMSPGDEYRVVQTQPKSGEEQPRHYFQVPPDTGFRLIQSFDLYQVFKRE